MLTNTRDVGRLRQYIVRNGVTAAYGVGAISCCHFASGFRARAKLFEVGPLTQSAIVPRLYFKPGREACRTPSSAR
jgi:hypothetical protein